MSTDEEIDVAAREASVLLVAGDSIETLADRVSRARRIAADVGRERESMKILVRVRPLIADDPASPALSFEPSQSWVTVTGLPEQVAGELEELADRVGADGLCVEAEWTASYAADVSLRMVPWMARHGRLRPTGTTLTESLGLAAPPAIPVMS